MNTDNFDLEQMRKTWIEMGKVLGIQSIPGSKPQDLDRKKTALDRLRERYQTFWLISLIMTFASFLIFSRGIFTPGSLNLWLGIAFAAYFLTASCMDFWLWRGIGSIDPVRMSISEISGKSLFYRKRHLQFMAILIPLAFALIGFMAYVYSSEIYIIDGMVTGIAIGAIIGVIQFRRFMAEYRKLSD